MTQETAGKADGLIMETASEHPTAAQSLERRSEPRSCSTLPVIITMAGRQAPGIAVDVSLTGACIECTAQLDEGDRISLSLAVQPTPITVDAEVRWVTWERARVRAGVRFGGMRVHDVLRWTRYLASLT